MTDKNSTYTFTGNQNEKTSDLAKAIHGADQALNLFRSAVGFDSLSDNPDRAAFNQLLGMTLEQLEHSQKCFGEFLSATKYPNAELTDKLENTYSCAGACARLNQVADWQALDPSIWENPFFYALENLISQLSRLYLKANNIIDAETCQSPAVTI